MKKKLLSTVTAVVCSVVCAFGLSACKNGEHECEYTKYGFAGVQHWAFCPVEGCFKQLPPENHTFIDSVCVCGQSVLAYYVTEDGNSAFVQGWHYGVFEGLNALKDIVVSAEFEGKPVTEIQSYAFAHEEEVETITLPATINKIGDYAFQNDTNLKQIIFKGTEAQWAAISKDRNWDADSSDFTRLYNG